MTMTKKRTRQDPADPARRAQTKRRVFNPDLPLIDDVPPLLLILSVSVSGLGFLLAYLFLTPMQSLCADAAILIAMPPMTHTLQHFHHDVWPLWRNTLTCIYLYNLPGRSADVLTTRWAKSGPPEPEDARLNDAKSEKVTPDVA